MSPTGAQVYVPWPVDDSDVVNHYPEARHMGRYNLLYCDGHVTVMTKAELREPMYYTGR